MRRLIYALVLVLLIAVPGFAADRRAAKVSDLAWMSGHYEGSTGNGTLEENWAKPVGGSIASLVRSTDGEKTTMIELIVVEEEEGSLVLRLQQWNPGFAPRTEGPQVMKLIEISDNKVVFEDVSGGGLKKLGYSREGNQFTISIETAGGSFDIPLMTQSPH